MQQRQQLSELVNIQEEIKQAQAVQTKQLHYFDPVPTLQTIQNSAVAFGALPLQLVQHIQYHSDSAMKLRSVEDLEKFMNEMSAQQKQQLLNFASSFITFVEDFFIEDEDMKVVLVGVRILSKRS